MGSLKYEISQHCKELMQSGSTAGGKHTSQKSWKIYICDYLHQHYSSGTTPIEEISISSGPYMIGDKQIVVRFKESEQQWVFFIYPYELKNSEKFRFEHQIKATAHYFYQRKEVNAQ